MAKRHTIIHDEIILWVLSERPRTREATRKRWREFNLRTRRRVREAALWAARQVIRRAVRAGRLSPTFRVEGE